MATKILIIKTSALGDIINSLPVLDYLHKAVKECRVDWVAEEPFLDVLSGNPLLSEIHLVRTKVWRKKPFAGQTRREISDLKKVLRERQYDLVFDIQGNLKSGLICRLTDAPEIIGFAREDLQEIANLLFTTRQIPLRPTDYHVTEKYLRVVSVPFGRDYREFELSSNISTGSENDRRAEILFATLADGLVFLFHYGTTWQTKFWSQESWVALGKQVLDKFQDSTILFSWGNESEKDAVTEIALNIGQGARVIDRYSLKGLAAILKKVDLAVGGDTGPIHLAAVVGTPTVSFYRSSDGKASGPRGANHRVIQSPLHCTRCFRTRCDDDAKCRESISVEKVMAGIVSILSDTQKQKQESPRW